MGGRPLPRRLAAGTLALAVAAGTAVLMAAVGPVGPARAAVITSAARSGSAARPLAVPAASGCADVLFVGARGSGEKGPGAPRWKPSASDRHGLGATVNAAYRRVSADLAHRTVQVASVRYAANSVVRMFDDPHDYFANLSKGVSWTENYLSQRARACPHQQLVLAGFSQGAMVMHRVLHYLEHARGGATILARLSAAVLTGDGDQVPHDTGVVRFGTASKGARGVGLALRTFSHSSTTKFTRSVGDRVLSVCDKHDIVCDWTDTNLRTCKLHPTCWKRLVKIHEGYPGTSALRDAADRAAYDVRKLPLPTPATVALTATAGSSLGHQLTADVDSGYSLQWGLLPPAVLPRGLSLSASGLLSGRPAKAGTATVPVRVRARHDGKYGAWVAATIRLTVSPAAAGWRAIEAPLPAGARSDPQVSITSVTCASASECVAVGEYLDNSNNWQGLLLTWAGGAWSAVQAPLPAGATGLSDLDAVACPSSSWCVAVGSYWGTGNTAEIPLLLTGFGSSWTAAAAPQPAGAANPAGAGLGAVACSSLSSCVAVGDYTSAANPNGLDGLVVSGSGASWVASAPAPPAGSATAYYSSLQSVSCPATTSCTIAGTYDTASDNSVPHPWALSGSGSSWTSLSVPPPATYAVGYEAYLQHVSCAAASRCLLTGAGITGGNAGLLLGQSGSALSSSIAPLPAGAFATGQWPLLEGVACPTASDCTVAGAYQDSADLYEGLLLTGRPGSMTPTEAPLPANAEIDEFGDHAGLAAVACPAASACVAVGSYTATTGGQAAALTGSGTSWKPTEVPQPANAYAQGPVAGLGAVACPSVSVCVAVGTYLGPAQAKEGLLAIGPG